MSRRLRQTYREGVKTGQTLFRIRRVEPCYLPWQFAPIAGESTPQRRMQHFDAFERGMYAGFLDAIAEPSFVPAPP